MRAGDIASYFHVMTLLHFELLVFLKRKSFLVADVVKGQYVC